MRFVLRMLHAAGHSGVASGVARSSVRWAMTTLDGGAASAALDYKQALAKPVKPAYAVLRGSGKGTSMTQSASRAKGASSQGASSRNQKAEKKVEKKWKNSNASSLTGFCGLNRK